MRQEKSKGKKKESSPSNDKKDEGCKWKKFGKVKQMINGYISKLVDERVNALYPCLKERIQNGEEITEIISEVIHKGFECKGCTMNPIAGVRYECPKCINFNLCENCEVKIDHDHNLLKVKKIAEKKNDK